MSHILIVDDEPSITNALALFFERNGGHIVTRAHSGTEGIERFMQDRPDVVLLDLKMRDISGFSVLDQLRQYDPVVIVITAHGDIAIAVDAIKSGAENFLTKPIDLPHLAAITERALEKARLKRLNGLLRAQSAPAVTVPLLGNSPAILDLARNVEELAMSDRLTGLLLGESGTGKGRVAYQIHTLSKRASSAFVEVNCATVNHEALESEMFGHERGAFAGAVETKPGAFELAEGGTVFLDEIADIPLSIQARLLEVLEGKGFQRTGGAQRINTNLRILAATSKDLVTEVHAGRLREDLYYRLSVMPIHLPPLRAREREDLLALIRNVMLELSSYVTDASQAISDEALEQLLAYSWPGNIRELRNAIERALLVAHGAPAVKVEHLPSEVRNAWEAGDVLAPKTLLEVERAHIHRMLRAQNLNRTKTAKVLGISRATLVKKIKQFGLMFQPGM